MLMRKVIFFFGFSLMQVLCASEQLVVVIASEMKASTAVLTRYEKRETWKKVGETVPVIIGRSGLGWENTQEPQKNEGDGRSPAGVFEIRSTFGYADDTNSAMPYYYADKNLICVDDAEDERYNKMALLDPTHPPKSYEVMRREDGVYRYGALIGYNDRAQKGRGSCIFFHLSHSDKRPTSGCTAMEEQPLIELLSWLKAENHPRLLQIPKSECAKYQKEFVGIECE